MSDQAAIEPEVFAALNRIESKFNEAEDALLRRQVELYNPIYEERDPLLANIPKFWLTVLGETQELEELFNLEDSKLLDHLQTLKVTRKTSDSRNFTISMEFEENQFLDVSNLTLSKTFTKALEEASSGNEYTSTETPIKWKKDVTSGTDGGRPSFFKFFAWTGTGEDEFEQGEEVALVLADEVYPDALKIWTEAQELDSDADSELGSVDIESGDEEDEEEEEEDNQAKDGEQDGPQKKKARTS